MDPSRLIVFSDFDGTISTLDTCDLIIDAAIGRERRQAIDDAIVNGELTFREGIQQQFDAVSLTWDEALAHLNGLTGVDPNFLPFVSWCETNDVPLVILSSGLEPLIRHHLTPLGLGHLDIRANRVTIQNRRWRLHHRDESPLGHDKAAALRQAKVDGHQVLYVGDGISDMSVARVADVLFAKKGERLAEWCEAQGIAYFPFTNFNDVLVMLKEIMFDRREVDE